MWFWFVLCSLALLLLVSGGYTFFLACRRKKEISWLIEEEVAKTSYRQYFKCISDAEKWVQTHNAEQLYMESEDGLKLHAFWVPARQPKGTILLAHGYRSTWRADFGLVLPLYHDLGYNLLVPDQRSHGLSEGKYITFGVKESRDMLGWIEFHNREKGDFPVLLSGLSMGASTMLYLADEPLPENVKGILADCGFTSPWEIIGCVFKRVIHLPAAPSLFVASLFAKLFAGFGFKDKDSRETLKSCKLPVMLVHGLADDFVPAEMTKQAFDACKGDKRMFLVEGAGHGVSFLHDTEGYLNAVKQFLSHIFS